VDWDDSVIAPPERDAWFCLHWEWAMRGFNESIQNNGIDYTLRFDRLTYYFYHSVFWYLTKYMGTYLELGGKSGTLIAEIADYLENCWFMRTSSLLMKT
jgi:hypothetical protein